MQVVDTDIHAPIPAICDRSQVSSTPEGRNRRWEGCAPNTGVGGFGPVVHITRHNAGSLAQAIQGLEETLWRLRDVYRFLSYMLEHTPFHMDRYRRLAASFGALDQEDGSWGRDPLNVTYDFVYKSLVYDEASVQFRYDWGGVNINTAGNLLEMLLGLAYLEDWGIREKTLEAFEALCEREKVVFHGERPEFWGWCRGEAVGMERLLLWREPLVSGVRLVEEILFYECPEVFLDLCIKSCWSVAQARHRYDGLRFGWPRHAPTLDAQEMFTGRTLHDCSIHCSYV